MPGLLYVLSEYSIDCMPGVLIVLPEYSMDCIPAPTAKCRYKSKNIIVNDAQADSEIHICDDSKQN